MKKHIFSSLRFLMGTAKMIAVFFCFLIFFLSVLFVSVIFIFKDGVLKRRIASLMIRTFNRVLVRIINIKIKVKGVMPAPMVNKRGLFLVSNHLSYTDGFILGSLFPLIYIGKSELKSWPLIGLMSDFSGTLFVDRKSKNHIHDYISVLSETLLGGVNVLFFPEGTSSDGTALLPFKAPFFDAPLISDAPIIAVSLSYKSVDGEKIDSANKDLVYWYADMTFFGHFFKLLSCFGFEVEVNIHPAVSIKPSEDRNLSRKLACEAAFNIIQNDLQAS